MAGWLRQEDIAVRDKILIFGGTTEGRLLAKKLGELGIPHVVSVATEYGKTVELESGEDSLLVGRLEAGQIAELIRSGEYCAVVDATHPFAIKASEEIRNACEREAFTYLRLVRKDEGLLPDYENVDYVNDVQEAACALDKARGNILLLTGSRDLKELMAGIRDKSRVFVRIIPDVASIEKCHEAGLSGRQIIAMQGPFSEAMNEALIREVDAGVILTKESGQAGGFGAKIQAAKNCEVRVIVVKNPERELIDAGGLGLKEIVKKLQEITGVAVKNKVVVKSITLAGVGPGDSRFYTLEFTRALKKSDVVFGAESVIERLEGVNVPKMPWYEGEKIGEYLDLHNEFMNPLVVFSGDISLCSGAKKAGEFFEGRGYRVSKITGVSSVALFAGRIGAALEDVSVVSHHGRDCDVAGYIRKNERLIVLPSGAADALEIAGNTDESCRVVFGVNLGCGDEKVIEYRAADFRAEDIGGKVILYIENPGAKGEKLIPALKDDEIIRGDVPMTKEEVRALSLRKLGLTKGSVLTDVGAGTGSISLEAALLDPTVKVISIEKKEAAVALLKQNRAKFGLGNMEIVEGAAPEVLEGLSKPTHVFVGGSSGKLKEIVEWCVSDNGRVRFVVNCVTLETLGQTMEVIKSLGGSDVEVMQITAARYREAGNYHMADGLNPVFIIAFELEGVR